MTIQLHLGAHKTATTFMQEVFDLNRARMAADGQVYFPLLEMRSLVMAFYDIRSNPVLMAFRSLARRERVGPRLCRRLEGIEDVLLSEENLIGNTEDSLGADRFYPRADARLAKFRRYFPDRKIKVWFCVRHPGNFLASSYAESLRHGYRERIDDFVARNSAAPQRWADLIRRMHTGLGEAEFVVWPFRDFSALQPRILQGMTGIPAHEIILPMGPEVRASASLQAIEAQDAALAGEPDNAELLMLQHEGRYPRSDFPGKFDPWNKETRAAMDEIYEADIEAIKALPFVEYLSV